MERTDGPRYRVPRNRGGIHVRSTNKEACKLDYVLDYIILAYHVGNMERCRAAKIFLSGTQSSEVGALSKTS